MNLLFLFLIAFGSSLILTKLTIIWAKKFGLVDDPKKRSHPAILHKKPVARAGGLPIFVAFLISVVSFVGFPKEVVGILLGGLVLILVGIFDDKYDLKTPYKFAAQILAAFIVLSAVVVFN